MVFAVSNLFYKQIQRELWYMSHRRFMRTRRTSPPLTPDEQPAIRRTQKNGQNQPPPLRNPTEYGTINMFCGQSDRRTQRMRP